uniref:Uncharacterized protein n=1 Tax=Ixodes ricinus TaxID=34613 RepID=A0A6B0UNS4_IXORI
MWSCVIFKGCLLLVVLFSVTASFFALGNGRVGRSSGVVAPGSLVGTVYFQKLFKLLIPFQIFQEGFCKVLLLGFLGLWRLWLLLFRMHLLVSRTVLGVLAPSTRFLRITECLADVHLQL